MVRFLPFALMCLPLAAQSILTVRGLAPFQVLQRDAANTASARLEGTAQGLDGKTIAIEVAGTGVQINAAVAKGAWSAELRGIPAGGPYMVSLKAGASAPVVIPNVLVGDLWILAGQSNMEGVGNLADTPLPSNLVNSFDMTDTWGMATDPLHRLPDAVNRVHWRKDPSGNPAKLEGDALKQWMANRKKGAGAGLPFALEMVRRTGVPIGLIPCAHGGTSMDQWSPALKDKGGDSLYGGMVRRFLAAGGKVKGLLWYQGESDASAQAAPLFEEKFTKFIAAVRTDFNQPDLPFYYVQIGRHVSAADARPWNLVQQVQLDVEAKVPHTGMVTCVDCNLDDGIHVGTDDHRLLGARLANLACHDLFPEKAGCAALLRGPRPVAARLEGATLLVEFREVNGKLQAPGRVNGFTIHDAEGKPLPLVFRQRVSATRPNVVELLIGGKLPEGAVLHYGAGRDPYVNLRDEAGMAVPVFGPLRIQN